ncbi:MAG TPA: hypothetical protein VFE62_08845 [Gemmataceae bacterium]|nr:hypothetical protein [Gemmataceae bacterium]
MVRLGERLFGILLVLLVAPVLLAGIIAASFDVGHYKHIRKM